MVDLTNGVTGMLPNVQATEIITWIMWACIGFIICGLLGWWVWKIMQKRKFGEFKVVIWEADSTGNTHESYDRAGIFLDKKTGFKLLFLEKMKKGLNPNKVPFVPSKDRKGRLIKTVYMRKIGVSNYVFCHVKIDDKGVAFSVGEEDVNWAAQDIEKIRRTFNKEGWLTKLAPYLMFIVTIMIVMIILISLFNKFTVLESIGKNMAAISEQQLQITQSLESMTNRTIENNVNIPVITPGTVGGTLK